MLARDRSLVEFVKKVSAICRGKAYFTNTMTLGQFILNGLYAQGDASRQLGLPD